MKSTQQKIMQLEGLLGTGELREKEEGFVQTLSRHLRSQAIGLLTEAQIDWMEDLYRRHFA